MATKKKYKFWIESDNKMKKQFIFAKENNKKWKNINFC